MEIEKVIEILEECKLYATNTDNHAYDEIREAFEIAIYILKALYCINGLYKWR